MTKGLPDVASPQNGPPTPHLGLLCGSLDSKIQRGPLPPSSLPLGQELPATMTKDVPQLPMHTPSDKELPPDLLASSLQEEPRAPCNTQGERNMPVAITSTHLALPGHNEGCEPFP